MDGSLAIERNRVALTRIVASLIAMAGLAGGQGTRAESAPRRTLPHHLWLAILRLLRPAEAAARRLIIAAARGIVVPAPRSTRSPAGAGPRPIFGRYALQGRNTKVPAGTARFLPRVRGRGTAEGGGGGVGEPQPSPRRIALPLFDPLRRTGPRRIAARDLPRICVPGWTQRRPVPVRIAPSPDDPISATRLALRLDALARALEDLPRQAGRFARLKARLDAPRTHDAPGRFRRLSP